MSPGPPERARKLQTTHVRTKFERAQGSPANTHTLLLVAQGPVARHTLAKMHTLFLVAQGPVARHGFRLA